MVVVVGVLVIVVSPFFSLLIIFLRGVCGRAFKVAAAAAAVPLRARTPPKPIVIQTGYLGATMAWGGHNTPQSQLCVHHRHRGVGFRYTRGCRLAKLPAAAQTVPVAGMTDVAATAITRPVVLHTIGF